MFKYFLKRELKESYLGNLTGLSWVIIQPILTLLIYTFVFEKIFNSKFPEAENVGFVVYLAMGLWPWIAFSDAIIKSITTVTDQKSFIGKIKINLTEPVFAIVTASFVLNVFGYIFVLCVLILVGKNFNYGSIPLLILPLLQLYVLALAFGLFFSAIQVFIRDTVNLMGTLITLWFFTTPIIYTESLIPESLRVYMYFNPIYVPIKFIHNAMITGNPLPWAEMGIVSIAIGLFFYLALKMFKKLEPSFEDYL